MDHALRVAGLDDLAALHPMIERGYRGDAARAGWTHEADLLEGARIDRAALVEIVRDSAQRLLIAFDHETPIGCVQVSDRAGGLAYLGLLCVEPALQAAGLGRKLVAAAEACARDTFGADTIEMTVIEKRTELIGWYRRRGYAVSGEKRPFPITLDPPFHMTVLVKPLV